MTVTRAAAPEVRIENAFVAPLDNSVAAARTCYSARGIITPREAGKRKGLRNRIAQSIYQAGHHTTFQHAHFQFALSGVSRHFIWSFLHSHPFYNSEQVSQRYVTVEPENVYVPALSGPELHVYEETVSAQVQAYQDLSERLIPIVESEYLRLFPARADRENRPRSKRYIGDIRKKAQEVARYCLPVATLAYLYHTVSCLTLLRYWRLVDSSDTPTEQRNVVGKMVEALLQHDPEFESILEGPLALEESPEAVWFEHFHHNRELSATRGFLDEFDTELKGRVSRLVSWKARGQDLLADSVREVLGLRRIEMENEQAIRLVLDPEMNPLLGESLNLSAHSKLMRALVHPAYTFKKILSHTADSQDQRHRLTPASRPILATHWCDQPDYVVPPLILMDSGIEASYREIMDRSWEGMRKLQGLGVDRESCEYLLPNAVSVRFTESSDLLALRHKLAMRLCYNAQEEIWRASLEEALQVSEIEPLIGRYLLPPCKLRMMSGAKPYCPEGDRYCGIPVWKLDPRQYERIL